MTRRLDGFALAAMLAFSVAAPTSAQQRPLATHDPEVIGPGQILAEAGFDYGRDQLFPASGLKGNLLRAPLFGVTVGLGSIVDIQVSGGLYDKLSITSRQPAAFADLVTAEGNTTTDTEDFVVATRVRLVEEDEGRPAVGLRVATRVPFSGLESGLGLGTMDFHATALIGKTIGSLRVVGNLGLAVLGSPDATRSSNTALTYGASVARAMNDTVEVVGELNGRASLRSDDPPPGTEDRSLLKLGARYTRGALRFDAGIMLGLTTRDPSFGVTGGITYALKAFTVR